MLAMGARVVGPGLAIEIVKNFLATDFSNEEDISDVLNR